MKFMQQGLQVIAGSRIRRLIRLVTSNRFLAVGIGVFITTLGALWLPWRQSRRPSAPALSDCKGPFLPVTHLVREWVS